MTRNYDAFTLAEVLITLVIVGIIAAMTIPTLINKTNKQEYVSRLIKAYSTLAQATNRIIAEEGNPKGDIGGWADSSEHIYQLYKKYLSNAKECSNTTKCFEQFNGQGYKWLNNSGYDGDWVENDPNNDTRTLILADGVQVVFLHKSNTCEYGSYSQTNRCAEIAVDVNGIKGPNTWGRDAFRIAITPDGLQPYGCNGACKNPLSTGGQACTCKVLQERAMNY